MDDVGLWKPAQPTHKTKQARSRPSIELEAVHSSRLRKQSANGTMENATEGRPYTSTEQSTSTMASNGAATSSGGFAGGAKARKPSIRNAVRKMFGRRARDSVSQGPDTLTTPSAPRHTHHKSEPPALVPHREEPEPEPYMQDTDLLEQTLSDPYPSISQPSFNRTGSPYAVQFPYSARLKPMNLGNPFIAPSNQLRRRKTLPGMVEDEPAEESERPVKEAMQSAVAAVADDQFKMPPRTPSQIKKARRKSRSTDDLKSSIQRDDPIPRERNEEIRFWRESLQPDILRTSNITTNTAEEGRVVTEHRSTPPPRRTSDERRGLAQEQDRATPMTAGGGLLSSSAVPRSGMLGNTSPFQPGSGASASMRGLRSSPGGETETSKDLEDRVAKLEAGLQNFQRSLQRLTAERNRRTVIMGGGLTQTKTVDDERTPSFLADTLTDNLEPSAYQYEYGQTSMRPVTSPQPTKSPRQPQSPQPPQQQPRVQQPTTLEDPFGPDLPQSSGSAREAQIMAEPMRVPSPLRSHPPTQQPPRSETSASRGPAQPYTFSSLYQMLADERSARRKLEAQLRSLQQDISDLHVQVASSSAVQSQRSSYMMAGSSSRLQDLLRETESSPPETSQQQLQQRERPRDSGSYRPPPPIMSRFDETQNEAGAIEHEELETPYEAYQTPIEERGHFPLALHQADTDDHNDADAHTM